MQSPQEAGQQHQEEGEASERPLLQERPFPTGGPA